VAASRVGGRPDGPWSRSGRLCRPLAMACGCTRRRGPARPGSRIAGAQPFVGPVGLSPTLLKSAQRSYPPCSTAPISARATARLHGPPAKSEAGIGGDRWTDRQEIDKVGEWRLGFGSRARRSDWASLAMGNECGG